MRQRLRRRDFHLHVDGFRAHVQRPAKNIGEAQHIVDLVGIIGPARRHDGVGTRRHRLFRRDFRVGICHGEYDRVLGHGFQHGWRQRALRGETVENIGAFERLRQRARARLDRVRALPLIHALDAATINHAFGVAERDIRRIKAERLGEIETCDAGGAGAVADEFRGFDVAPGQLQGIEHSRGRNDRRSMLIVMEDGNIHQFAQPLFDDETFRRFNILEIYAAECRPQIAHGADELLDILGVDLEVDRINVGEPLEQRRLSLHHRLRRERAEISQSQNRRAIGDDRDHIPLDRAASPLASWR